MKTKTHYFSNILFVWKKTKVVRKCFSKPILLASLSFTYWCIGVSVQNGIPDIIENL